MIRGDMDLKKYPVILLVDDRRGFLWWFIKQHTSGNYNHCCEIINEDLIATQDVWPGYRQAPLKRYYNSRYYLKVWRVKDMTDEQAKKWQEVISRDLNKPWVKRRYDFLGILGHLIRFKKFNNPYTNYCYEIISRHMNTIFGMTLLSQGSPASLDARFKNMPNMEVEKTYYKD